MKIFPFLPLVLMPYSASASSDKISLESVQKLISKENLSSLKQIKKKKDGTYGIWFSKEKHYEFIKGCDAIPMSYHNPSLGISFSKSDPSAQKFIAIKHNDNTAIFDIERKRLINFFGKYYLEQDRRMAGDREGDFINSSGLIFQAYENKGKSNYIYFPDSVQVYLISQNGDVKEFKSEVKWIFHIKCMWPIGKVKIEG